MSDKAFFCISDGIYFKEFYDMAVVLITSAKINTNLELYCLYIGTNEIFIKDIRNKGVTIIHPHVPYKEILLRSNLTRGVWKSPDMWLAAFLRFEVANVCKNLSIKEKYVWYLDIDTMLQHHPKFLENVPILAASVESVKDNWSFYNTGVMQLCVTGMLDTYKDLIDFSIKNNFNIPVCDQGILNAFYKGKFIKLPIEYNWKTYWGLNPEACVIHFHGLKPEDIRNYPKGKHIGGTSPVIIKNIENLKKYLVVWDYYKKIGTII